jgi:serine/threonine protein kinase
MVRQAMKSHGGEAPPAIDGYQSEQCLGIGGMGAVYLARRKEGNARVAIKVMLSRVAVDEHSRETFKREMEIVRGLHHDNIVEFIDHGSAGAAFYFIMEFCDGGNVADLMRRHGGKLPLEAAKPIMLQALAGLAHAHKNDFVHRDLKPQNILLCGSGSGLITKVSDFGLAKNFQKAGLSGHTVTGSYAGTSAYMPSEQVTNFKYVKPASDVWSLGATFYNMLTGELPRDFRRGQDPIEVVLRGDIVPIRRRDSATPNALAEVIDKALSKEVESRHPSAMEMLEAMKRAL